MNILKDAQTKRWVTLAGSAIGIYAAYLKLTGKPEMGTAVALFGGSVVALGLGRKSDRVKNMLAEVNEQLKEANKRQKQEIKTISSTLNIKEDPMAGVRNQ